MRIKVCLPLTIVATILISGCGKQPETKSDTLASKPAEGQVSPFDTHIQKANALFKKGDLAAALDEAKAAAKLDPKRYEAPVAAALILQAAGKADAAKGAIQDALNLAPAEQKEKVEAIAKMLAAPAAGSDATPTAPSASAKPAELSGTAKRQLNSLMLIIEEADKAMLDTERKKLLQEFLDKSEPFVKENPSHLPVWTLRAVAALELDAAVTGWEAGQQLIRLGADNSADAKVQKVTAMLGRKGWLGNDTPANPSSATKDNGKEIDMPVDKLLSVLKGDRLTRNQLMNKVAAVDIGFIYDFYWKVKVAQDNLNNLREDKEQELKKIRADNERESFYRKSQSEITSARDRVRKRLCEEVVSAAKKMGGEQQVTILVNRAKPQNDDIPAVLIALPDVMATLEEAMRKDDSLRSKIVEAARYDITEAVLRELNKNKPVGH